MTEGSGPVPGWYHEAADGAWLRYWDGSAWTSQRTAAASISRPVAQQPRAAAASTGPGWGDRTTRVESLHHGDLIRPSAPDLIAPIVKAVGATIVWCAALAVLVVTQDSNATEADWLLIAPIGVGNLLALWVIPYLITDARMYFDRARGLVAALLVADVFAVTAALIASNPGVFGVRFTAGPIGLIFVVAVFVDVSRRRMPRAPIGTRWVGLGALDVALLAVAIVAAGIAYSNSDAGTIASKDWSTYSASTGQFDVLAPSTPAVSSSTIPIPGGESLVETMFLFTAGGDSEIDVDAISLPPSISESGEIIATLLDGLTSQSMTISHKELAVFGSDPSVTFAGSKPHSGVTYSVHGRVIVHQHNAFVVLVAAAPGLEASSSHSYERFIASFHPAG